jgi:hypothetical protein
MTFPTRHAFSPAVGQRQRSAALAIARQIGRAAWPRSTRIRHGQNRDGTHRIEDRQRDLLGVRVAMLMQDDVEVGTEEVTPAQMPSSIWPLRINTRIGGSTRRDIRGNNRNRATAASTMMRASSAAAPVNHAEEGVDLRLVGGETVAVIGAARAWQRDDRAPTWCGPPRSAD